MFLKRTPQLLAFFTQVISNADYGQDEAAVLQYCTAAGSDQLITLQTQISDLLNASPLPLGEIGSEANRWFETDAEAQEWLEQLKNWIAQTQNDSASNLDAPVKDSNGTLLAEGDAVTVIKDLKVKGGSSDLKRGTLIKKIHLIGDPDHIECRFDGSTLVLKTCFLKKA